MTHEEDAAALRACGPTRYTPAVPFPRQTDMETLQRLLACGKLTLIETADVQRSLDAVVAGKELPSDERLKANLLYHRHQLGQEPANAGRKRGHAQNAALAAKFDAMPRPKKPPGRR